MIEQDTVKLLRECDAGTKMGISSIDEVLPYVHSRTLRALLEECKQKHEELKEEMLTLLAEAFNGIEEWSGEAAFQVIKPLAKANGVKVGAAMFPLRMALTGTHAGPGIDVIMQVLGRDEVLRRIEIFPC